MDLTHFGFTAFSGELAMQKVKNGISLMELVASMCIIAALATAVTPVVSNLVEQARYTHALQDISTLQDQLNAFGESLNGADALLDENFNTLFTSDTPEGAIAPILESQLQVGTIALAQKEADALIASQIRELHYRSNPLVDGIAPNDQWSVRLPVDVGTQLLRVDMEDANVAAQIKQQFPGLDFDAIDEVANGTHTPTVLVVGIGRESDLVKTLGELPTDLNAGDPERFYDRYLAVVWVGSRKIDASLPIPASEVVSLPQAKVLGVVDSQLRTKSELAKLICP
jgi:type II secretory pathway pseudopilin PulG